MREENNHFKAENKKLQKDVETLSKKLRLQEKYLQRRVKEKVYEILSPVFTTGQINKLLNPHKKKIKWSNEDIASAIALRSVTPKGYRYLRKKNMPLPALSTLRKKASEIDINTGEAFHVNCPSARRASLVDTKMFMILKSTLKNCLISVFDVFFSQLSNDVGTFFEIFHFHLQKLSHSISRKKHLGHSFKNILSYVKNAQLSI